MANDAQRDAEPVFRAENEVDLLLGGANPNPTRQGCPPGEALVSLARRQVPVGDPLGEHLSKCSPCYREMRAIQQAEGIRPADERPAARPWWPAAAAAVLVVAAGLAWFVYGGRQPGPTRAPEQVVAQAEPVAITLDLRKYSVTRSDEPAAELPPLVLPRAKVNLTLLLPTGSEPGEYEVRVVSPDGRVVSESSGTAQMQNYVTMLNAELNLQPLEAGDHRLTIRRSQEQWQHFDVKLR
jgi:hypothetical protein